MRLNETRNRTLAFIISLALVMSASVLAAGLAGSEWRPVQIGEMVPLESAGIFVKFEPGGRLSGYSGCNRFFGTYEIADESIEIGPLGATRMACSEPVMALESTFLSVLQEVTGFNRNATRLTLMDEHGHSSVQLIQTDWD